MKDTPERPDAYLPARRSNTPPPMPAPEYPADDYAPESPPPAAPRGINLRLVLRALRRYWVPALVVWLLLSGGLMATAYFRIKPTYDAVSQIKIETTGLAIFANTNPNSSNDLLQFMETQVSNILSPTVVNQALQQHPELHTFPLLRDSVDAVSDIRHAIRAGVVPRTNLIQVEMSSQSKDEAKDVVNAVVEAYLRMAKDSFNSSSEKQIERLKETRDRQISEVDRQRKLIDALHKSIGSGDVERIKNRNVTSLDNYRRLSEELTRVQILRIAAKAKLDQLHNEKALPVTRAQNDDSLNQAVTDQFYADPRVALLQQKRERAEAKLHDMERLVRNHADPAWKRANEEVEDLNAKINELWSKLSPAIRQRVTMTPADEVIDRKIGEVEAELAALKIQEETLEERLQKLQIENKTAEGDVLKLEYARRDLDRADTVLNRIEDNLNQLLYDARSPTARVELHFPAQPTNRAMADKRNQVMAVAPVATGLVILGLLVLLELRGARVADPEELAARMNLQVIGVVPPLPQLRPAVGGHGANGKDVNGNGDGNVGLPAPSDLKAQRQLDEFVQSLDHLRVTLCARRDPWGRERHCVLITSACGSEGKTTLAAQLAERCVNAGLMTLLIDGDLRNPTLSRMLDASENLGLINVLKGEATAEDAMMVIGDAGGFHLLPAGNPRMDPSRLLQSDRLGKLVAQARESFDMIIIDAPPVLPVPDALTIGRWVDGAVLAVRYDMSRFPLVERAHRRLTRVGVSVIGAVVNGVRSMESSYYGGYYTYGYGYGSVYGDGMTSSTTTAASPSGVDD